MPDSSQPLPTNQDRLAYTIDEIPGIVPISRSKIYEEIRAGRLRVTKIGRRSIVTRRDIEDWIELLRSPEQQVDR